RETARRYNLVNEMLRAHRAKQINQDGQPDARGSDAIEVSVKNGTSGTIARFGVLGISAPLVTPATGVAAFQSGIVLVGATPLTASHTGRFVIAQEPIPPSGVGTCRIAGASIVQ